MSFATQIIISIVLEIIALACSVTLVTHKDADAIMRSCGLCGTIGISIVFVVEIGLAIAYAVNPW